MRTSWWLALGAVVLLAAVASMVDGRARLGPRRRAARSRRRNGRGPRAGEIWQARIDGAEDTTADKAEGTAAPAHPCLVLTVHGDRARVARITHHRGAADLPGALPLPPGVVVDEPGEPGFLLADAPREVPVWTLHRRLGEADPLLWERARHLAE